MDLSALPDDGTKIIQELTQEEWVEGRGKNAARVRKTKIKLYIKLDALEKLARHLKLYDGVQEHEHKHTYSSTHRITAEEVAAEVEEMFNYTPHLPPPGDPTKH